MTEELKKRRRRRRIEAYAISFSVLAALLTVAGVTTFAVRTTTAAPSVQAASDSWLAGVQAKLEDNDYGFARINLSDRIATISGEARNAGVKDAALKMAETEIAAAAPGVLVVDNLSVLGGETALGQALASLGPSPTVEDCNAAFTSTLEGRFIGFETGSASITQESARLLRALTGVAIKCRQWPIEIGGHTDLSGQADANMALSTARAEAVRTFLIDSGAPGEKLQPVGYGMTQPKVRARNRAADAQNRRIQFTVKAQ